MKSTLLLKVGNRSTVQTLHHVPKMTRQQWEKVETCRPSNFVSVVVTVSLKTFRSLFVSACFQKVVFYPDRLRQNLLSQNLVLYSLVC